MQVCNHAYRQATKIKMLCIDQPRILCVVENIRAKQKTWINALLAARGGTLTDLARACRLNSTTLTRWYNDGTETRTLSARTLGRIAEVTGWQPYAIQDYPSPHLPASTGDLVVIPPGSTVWQAELESYAESITARHPSVFPRLVTSRSLELAGFLPGDICLIDQNEKAREGDAVCATVDYSRAGGPIRAESILRLFYPPFLLAATQDDALRRPLQVDERDVVIMGVVVGMFRPRLARAA